MASHCITHCITFARTEYTGIFTHMIPYTMQAPWLRPATPPPLPPPPTATVAAPPSPAPAKPQAKDHTVLAEAAFKELRCEWLAAMSHAM